jgi:hypothetical protein
VIAIGLTFGFWLQKLYEWMPFSLAREIQAGILRLQSHFIICVLSFVISDESEVFSLPDVSAPWNSTLSTVRKTFGGLGIYIGQRNSFRD